MTDLERVARAICEKACFRVRIKGPACYPSPCKANPTQLRLGGELDKARAAIQALLEPSPGMLDAASRTVQWSDGEIYRAMITAALASESEKLAPLAQWDRTRRRSASLKSGSPRLKSLPHSANSTWTHAPLPNRARGRQRRA